MAAQGAAAPPQSRGPRISPVMLTSSQESEVQALYHANVRAKCIDQIQKFAECVKEHMITANFTCSDQKLGMNQCLRHYGTREERDRARAEWLSKVDERRIQREKDAKEKIENEKKLKEWWGMDEDWKRITDRQGNLIKRAGRGSGDKT